MRWPGQARPGLRMAASRTGLAETLALAASAGTAAGSRRLPSAWMTGIWRSSGNWPSAAIRTEVTSASGNCCAAHGRGKQDVVWAAQVLCHQRQAVLLPGEDRGHQRPAADLVRTRQAAQAIVDGHAPRRADLGRECAGTAEQAFTQGELIGGRRRRPGHPGGPWPPPRSPSGPTPGQRPGPRRRRRPGAA